MAGVFGKVFLHVSIEKRSNHKRREIMMENNELLQAISNMMDQKLDPVKNEIQDMKGEIQTIKEDQAAMKSELQMQIKRTEQNLRTEIRESENLILQEVSRVHHILNDHIGNQNVHTA